MGVCCAGRVASSCMPAPQVCDVDQLEEVVEHRLGCAPNMKYFYQPAQRTYIGSPHQYNCTYFSALHGNPRHYLLARAIQFFTPGLPMVYYVGLLAGRNDHEVSRQWPTVFTRLFGEIGAGLSAGSKKENRHF